MANRLVGKPRPSVVKGDLAPEAAQTLREVVDGRLPLQFEIEMPTARADEGAPRQPWYIWTLQPYHYARLAPCPAACTSQSHIAEWRRHMVRDPSTKVSTSWVKGTKMSIAVPSTPGVGCSSSCCDVAIGQATAGVGTLVAGSEQPSRQFGKRRSILFGELIPGSNLIPTMTRAPVISRRLSYAAAG